jgi:BirA family transcriptional regulator, biotin operon repressor / biotin---[acetyl-CoA-carboxylase] ligase
MRIYLYDTVSSTNDVLKEKALAGEPEGSVIVAREQTIGRGRYGRSWLSRLDMGLYISILLRPPAQYPTGLLSLATGLATAKSINRRLTSSCSLKWPNDVLFQDRKIAGILVETHIQKTALLYVIVGIGINLYHNDQDLKSLDNPATSLILAGCGSLDRDELLHSLLKNFWKEYMALAEAQGCQHMLKRWRRSCGHWQKHVRIRNDQEIVAGQFIGVDDSGAALVELGTGEVVKTCTGEVTVQEL